MSSPTSQSNSLEIIPFEKPPVAVAPVPGSKSITIRALNLAALADGKSTLEGALRSEDTEAMVDCLIRLGFAVEADWNSNRIVVEGRGGIIPNSSADLFCENSGASLRFLTALCAVGNGTYRLDGIERMRERPIQDLLDALNDLGVKAISENGTGCPPVRIETTGLKGGIAELSANASTQFVSALLMAAPCASAETTIRIAGDLRPHYVAITTCMMEDWGVSSEQVGNNQFRIPTGQSYQAKSNYAIEPDASSASYMFGVAAITGGRITVPGLSSKALQGDVRFATEVLSKMGCKVTESAEGLTLEGLQSGELKGIDIDMSAISDTAPTLAAIAPFASTPTTIRGIAHSRKQECDRISAVCTELRKLGVEVEEYEDGYTIQPCNAFKPAEIETYNDHRIAMSFALIGLRVPGVTILNPDCVKKTFPTYWETLDRLRA